jgi:hypothetical protein
LNSLQPVQYQPEYVPSYTSPAACARRTISADATAWSGSVVRMNRSALIPKRSKVACQVAAHGSISSRGSIPNSRASRSTLAECSSMPVRKRVSCPSRRW